MYLVRYQHALFFVGIVVVLLFVKLLDEKFSILSITGHVCTV